MDFFSRIISFNEKLGLKKTVLNPGEECLKIMTFKEEVSVLLSGINYVAKSEYSEMIPAYKETVEFFRVLQNSKMLKNYCAQNGIAERDVINIIELYDHIEEKVDAANNSFINAQLASEKNILTIF